jgi:hypothetical protein
MHLVYAVDVTGREILARLTAAEWDRVKAAGRAGGRDAEGDLLRQLIRARPYLVVEDVMRSLAGLMLQGGRRFYDDELFRAARDALRITRDEFDFVLDRARQLGFIEPAGGD